MTRFAGTFQLHGIVFATTDFAGVVRLWDVSHTTPLDTVTSHDGKALCADWNPTANRDGVRSVYTGGSDCNINKFAFGVV